MLKDARLDGLVCWFDTDFSSNLLERKQSFSTGPFTETTHWKQTVFWVDGEYSLEKGDTIEGTIACQPNPQHKRELDIKISFIARDAQGCQIGDYHCQHFIMT